MYEPEDFEERLPAEMRGAAKGCRNWAFTPKGDAEPTEIELAEDDLVFDETDDQHVLNAAHRLTALPNTVIVTVCAEVTYFHLVVERQEITFAEGAPTESFYYGEMGLRALAEQQR